MAETTTPDAGVPLREHDVYLDVTPEQAVAANRSQRIRLLDEARALSPEEWQAQSRCSEWTVQGVVRHVVHVNTIQLDGLAAARADERFDFFKTFDPKRTPLEHLESVGDEPVDVTLAALEDTTTRLVAAIEQLHADGVDVLAASPVGRQPWSRAVLHGLFDSAVHERDILAPLGRRPAPHRPADEVTAIAAYQVLLVARLLAVVGIPVDVGLRLTGGPELRVQVDGTRVSVAVGGADAAPVVATGDVDDALDAMVGRGSLADVLDAPAEVVGGLAALSSLV